MNLKNLPHPDVIAQWIVPTAIENDALPSSWATTLNDVIFIDKFARYFENHAVISRHDRPRRPYIRCSYSFLSHTFKMSLSSIHRRIKLFEDIKIISVESGGRSDMSKFYLNHCPFFDLSPENFPYEEKSKDKTFAVAPGTSFAEETIKFYLSQIENISKVNKGTRHELDIFLPDVYYQEKQVAIEYDSSYHHTEQRLGVDKEKNKWCEENNIFLIRIRTGSHEGYHYAHALFEGTYLDAIMNKRGLENRHKSLSTVFMYHYSSCAKKYDSLTVLVNRIIDILQQVTSKEYDISVNVKRDSEKIREYMFSHI